MRTAFFSSSVLALTAFSSFAHGDTSPALRSTKELSTALAIDMAQTAIASCTGKGWKVAVSIVDRSGLTRLIVAGDGATPIAVESSRRKAHTAAAFGLSTAELGKVFAAQPQVASTFAGIDTDIIGVSGGLPIKAGEEVIGGIGVGGAHESAADEACAQVAIDKVKDRLK